MGPINVFISLRTSQSTFSETFCHCAQCHILYKTVTHFQDSSSSPWTERRGHFYICLMVINGTLSWALISSSCSHNHKHKAPIHVTLFSRLHFLPHLLNLRTHPCSCPFLHSLQDNTQKYGYLYINTGPPSFNSPPRPQHTASLLMPTVVCFSSISSVSTSTAKSGHFSQHFTVRAAAIIASKCLHNSPVSYDQKNKIKQSKIEYTNNQFGNLISSDTSTAGGQIQVRGWED